MSQTAPAEQNRVHIFDTTLRDGEQSPGISLNTQEKVEIAQQLARLGVDVIEAGFPITSPGDFEAVEAIARAGRGPGDLRPRAHPQGRHRRRLERDQGLPAARGSTPSSRPPTSTSSTSCRRRARTSRARPRPPWRWPVLHRRRRVLADGRDPRRRRVHRRGLRDRGRRGRDRRSTSPTRSATRPPRSTRATSRASTSWCPGSTSVALSVHCHDDLGPRRRQLLRGRAGRRPAGRVRRQRHRRARRQLLAGGDRDAAADPPATCTASTPASTRASWPAPAAWSPASPATRCRRTRRSSAATPSRTSPASTRTAC